MKTQIKALVVVLIWAFGCAPSESDGQTPLSKKMDEYLKAYEALGFSGAILVAEKGVISLHKGYGMADEANDIPASAQSIWTIGSITKPFTAAAILKLEMMDKLSVKDEIRKHIKGLDKDKGAITIHQLLTHTAGLREYSGPDHQSRSTEEFIEFLNDYPFKLDPGEQFAYSNVGYSVLGILIEKVSGKPYEQFLKEQLFDPAGMTNTGYNRPNWDPAHFAKGYNSQGDEWGVVFAKNNYDNPEQISWNLKANGGILSTPEDMFKWSQALKGESILSADAKNKYFGEHIKTPGDFSPFNDTSPGYYGYGWAVTESSNFKPVIMHGGSNDIYEAGYMYYPEQDIFFFLASNRVKHPAAPAILDFDKLIGGKPYEIPKLKVEAVLDEKVVADYMGTYTFDDGSQAIVERGDGDFKKWLTISPVDKSAYQKIIGKGLSQEEQQPFKDFSEAIMLNAKAKKPINTFMSKTRKSKKKKNKRDKNEEVILGAPDKSLEEIQLDFWTKNEEKFGPYQDHDVWAAVQVHDRVWVFTEVNFEKGTAYLTHYIGENELKRVGYSEHVTGLFLKPTKSPNQFREVNNEAQYELARNNKTQTVGMTVRIHKKEFSARKN